MSQRLSRRAALRCLVGLALGGALAGPSRAAAQRAPAPTGLTAYQFGFRVWVRYNGFELTCYRAEPTQKYPYFYPFVGPASGRSLTIESGQPYPHHRSILFACDRVNGANFWQQGTDRGQIVSRGPTIVRADERAVVLADRCRWQAPAGQAVIADERRFTITAPTPALRLLNAEITLSALADIHISRTNHSLFAIRAAPDLAPAGGGTLVNSAGRQGEKGTWGEKAQWCAFFAKRGEQVEGIALFDHPRNPWSPCPWFTRDYGFASPTPFYWLGQEGWSLAAGQSIRLRYLVVGFAGDPEQAGLGDLFRRWASGGLAPA